MDGSQGVCGVLSPCQHSWKLRRARNETQAEERTDPLKTRPWKPRDGRRWLRKAAWCSCNLLKSATPCSARRRQRRAEDGAASAPREAQGTLRSAPPWFPWTRPLCPSSQREISGWFATAPHPRRPSASRISTSASLLPSAFRPHHLRLGHCPLSINSLCFRPRVPPPPSSWLWDVAD